MVAISEKKELTDAARKLIREGDGTNSGFIPGEKPSTLALHLSARPSSLTKDDRKELMKDYKVNQNQITYVLKKLRKLGLWNDKEGGLGLQYGKEDGKIDVKKVGKEVGKKDPEEEKGLPAKPFTASPPKEFNSAHSPDSTVDRTAKGKETVPPGSSLTVPVVPVGKQTVPIRQQKMKQEVKKALAKDQPSAPPPKAPERVREDEGELFVKAVFKVLDERSRFLDERDRQAREAQEELARKESEDRKRALEIVAKQYNVELEDLPALLKQQAKNPPPQDFRDQRARNLSDAEKLADLLEQLPPEQLRLSLKRKTGTVENPMLTAFKYLETEASMVDIMEELNLDFDRAIDLQTKYNQMKRLELERQQLDEPYLKAWFDIAQVIGENWRRYCTHYHEVDGMCDFWKLHDISKTYRETFKGLYRSGKKKEGGFFVNVGKHAEVCALCSLGMVKMNSITRGSEA